MTVLACDLGGTRMKIGVVQKTISVAWSSSAPESLP
jgi:hexokinase